jgi:ABC-type multidrug transport system ATPase subunit
MKRQKINNEEIIIIKGLTKNFKSIRAVDNISFSIKKGRDFWVFWSK